MSAIDEVRGLLEDARACLPVSERDRIDDCAQRLRAPLRVALAGSLKAGKSTLLNALVGQDIAPTDATECTRVVTWYRNGRVPAVTAVGRDGRVGQVRVTRVDGRLSFDLGDLVSAQLSHLDVAWPSRALEPMTVVDTPGIASLTRELSSATEELLAPAVDVAGRQRQSGVDAVIYLMRAMTATDTDMLARIGAALGGSSGPVGIVGVISRADEVGAGRIDAMTSARRTAGRIASELDRTGLCQAVVPVAGLVALGARTMEEREFRGLLRLAALDAADLDAMLLSADRFVVGPGGGVDPAVRAALIDRYGMFGIRLAVTLIRFGASTAGELAEQMVARSGLDELHTALDTHIAARADQLKAHSALLTLDQLLAESGPDARTLGDQVRRLLADTHAFRELELMGRLRRGDIVLADDHAAELARLIGGHGVAAWARLGLAPQTSVAQLRAAALDAVTRWRVRGRHPLADAAAADAAQTAVRSAEGVVAELDSQW